MKQNDPRLQHGIWVEANYHDPELVHLAATSTGYLFSRMAMGGDILSAQPDPDGWVVFPVSSQLTSTDIGHILAEFWKPDSLERVWRSLAAGYFVIEVALKDVTYLGEGHARHLLQPDFPRKRHTRRGRRHRMRLEVPDPWPD